MDRKISVNYYVFKMCATYSSFKLLTSDSSDQRVFLALNIFEKGKCFVGNISKDGGTFLTLRYS